MTALQAVTFFPAAVHFAGLQQHATRVSRTLTCPSGGVRAGRWAVQARDRLNPGGKWLRTLGPCQGFSPIRACWHKNRRQSSERRFLHAGTNGSNPACSSGESHKLDHRDRPLRVARKTAARSMRSTARSPPSGRSGRPSRRPQFEQSLVERSVLFSRLSLGCAMGTAVDRDSTIV
jgi:hypothetical protein